jgi:hypothetical protein
MVSVGPQEERVGLQEHLSLVSGFLRPSCALSPLVKWRRKLRLASLRRIHGAHVEANRSEGWQNYSPELEAW